MTESSYLLLVRSFLLVFVMNSGVADHIFLVHARVVTLLAFIWLGALMVEHVLLFNTSQAHT